MLKYLTLGLSSLIAAISFYRKYRDIFDAMARDLERRTDTELYLRRENTNLKTQEQGLTEQNRQLTSEVNELKEQNRTTTAELEAASQNTVKARRQRDEAQGKAFENGNKLSGYMNDVLDMETCPCPACQLARKYPKYGYIHRVQKAVNRGDHVA